MSSLRPVEVFGLEVPPGEEPVPAIPPGQFPATFRVTMAAIDPTITKEEYAQVNGTPVFTGATLRIIRVPDDDGSDDDEDDEDDFDMAQLLNANSSEDESEEDDEDDEDEEDDEDDEEVNGGPSDPSKSPKAKREAARQKFREALAADGHDMEVDEDDDEDEDDIGTKLTAKQKGKAKAVDLDDLDDSDEFEFEPGQSADELVLCTLDLSRNYQQPLDITVNEHETVYFQVSGTHSVYLTGNILIPDGLTDEMYDSDEDDEDEEYDLPPDEDELEFPDEEDESDGLDDLDDPRFTELDSEDEMEAIAAPALVKANATQKGKKKRAREDSDNEMEDTGKASLDDLISKSLKPAATGETAQVNGIDESKLSKKQLKKMRKKLKDNEGNAVEASTPNGKEDLGVAAGKPEESPAGSAKSDKKVQFAKTLVQGPSSSSTSSSDSKKAEDSKAKVNGEAKPSTKPGLGPRNVQGVTVDDKKLGSGPASKKGDKVSMRYIGKLDKDKKVFDSNKKGKPFTFTLGASQVIKGWDIGVQGMAVGGERRITIPANLAYGSKGAGKDIPPNSTLVFDIKMLEIV